MWWKKSSTKPSSVREQLPFLNSQLEAGMWDNAVLVKLFAELDTTPETLLPAAMDELALASFLLWKCNRGEFAKRILFTSLAWYLKNSAGHEDISTITQNLQHIFEKEGNSVSAEHIQQTASGDHFGHATSWRLDSSAIGSSKHVAEIAGDKMAMPRTRFATGFTPLVSAKLPLTTFHGWLKSHDPRVLNSVGKMAIESIFPLFGERTPEQYLTRNERLASHDVALASEDVAELSTVRELLKEGVPVNVRRHRRYSGGDGLLPRGCYFSLCKNAAGDDGGSLSREFLAYVDRRVPGRVFVSDSSNDRMNAILGNSIKTMPGFCAIYVLLFAPDQPAQKAIFDGVYCDLLSALGGTDQPVHVIAFESRVDECTIENVIDLRLPRTQEWFFDQFKDGDGHFLTKNGGSVREFYDLVPILMHPALGGTDITHAVGSFMRSSGVNGLVFPSARSDASATMKVGELADWHGWNLVDYRTATNLPATELTYSGGGWPDFLQPGGQLAAIYTGEFTGSWKVTGLQSHYDKAREFIEAAAEGTSSVSPRASHEVKSARDTSRSFTVSMCDPDEIVTAPCLGSGSFKLFEAVELIMVGYFRRTLKEPLEIHRNGSPPVLTITEIQHLAASPYYR
jgi:hypothetical protein